MPVQCVFIFTSQAYGPDADYAARRFFKSGSVREDPAMGSANAVFAAYLRELKSPSFNAVVDQGVEINRPSCLYPRVGDALQAGGEVRLVAQGRLIG
jgi:predicted PhzF superfamily epimerase YddE/YHI9